MYNYNEVSADSVEFITVAKIDEVDDGDRLFVEIDDYELVVFNIAGEYFAIGDVCSHDDGPLGEGEIEDYDVICPRHGARFDVRSGLVTALPAVTDIPAYPVRVSGNDIEIGIPLDEE
jgi:3-phenylpropionate/trans-cinnamate dioxygenase ferredoxin subunit